MKKVIGVAVAASLVAGMAFAEVSVSLNSRLRSNMYHFIKNENGNKETYTFDLNNAKSHGGSGAMSDALGFKAKTDYAGVSLELTEGSIKYKNEDGDTKSVSFMKNDTKWSGWLKFSGLTLSFGQFDSRFISRYNTTMGESGLLDSDYAKYGLTSLADGDAKFLKDANNFSAVAGSRKNVLIADYTFADVAGGKLLVKAALLENNYKTPKDENDDDLKYTKAGFGFEADYQSNSVAVQGLFKKLNEDQMILGAYVEPKGLPVNAVLGFTYGSEKDKVKSAFAIDGRLQYKADALTLAGLVKYESGKADTDGAKTDTALAAGAEVSYVVNDKIGAFFDIMYINADLDDDDSGSVTGAASKIQVRPGVVFTAGKNAAITAAFQYDSYNDSDDRTTKTEYSIPVIFRVKL
ncbi:MAG: hypothetical protein SPF11_07135 [Treponema porcinum]|uniref:hypothetical protein n=1 Tax=Treponema porcinum TaxID=261392 RepID=UPI002A7F346F|nr:hypothetical protein [Treponema porcinum]MDY5049301.1 hypothetical protein [Treponema porcinum]